MKKDKIDELKVKPSELIDIIKNYTALGYLVEVKIEDLVFDGSFEKEDGAFYEVSIFKKVPYEDSDPYDY